MFLKGSQARLHGFQIRLNLPLWAGGIKRKYESIVTIYLYALDSHCGEQSDEAISLLRTTTPLRLLRCARKDMFSQSLAPEKRKRYTVQTKKLDTRHALRLCLARRECCLAVFFFLPSQTTNLTSTPFFW
jgi:hypothetical protein